MAVAAVCDRRKKPALIEPRYSMFPFPTPCSRCAPGNEKGIRSKEGEFAL